MDLRLGLKLAPRILMLQRARWLQMSEKDYQAAVLALEKDPIYRRLSDGSREGCLIRRQPFPRARFSQRAFSFDEGRPNFPLHGPQTPFPPEWEDVLPLLRRTGRGKFEKYFLGASSEDVAVAAQACGLSQEEAKRIFRFVDEYLIASELFPSPETRTSGLSFSLIAEVEKEGNDLSLAFLSPHYARGVYKIDYDLLKKQRSASSDPKEWKRVLEIVRQVELLNAKQTSLVGILNVILDVQAVYLRTGRADSLSALTQRDAASRLKVSASAVCRAIEGRSLRVPWGSEEPLESFFCSTRDVAVHHAREILAGNPGMRDSVLRERLQRRLGRALSRRVVNLYRHVANRRGKTV